MIFAMRHLLLLVALAIVPSIASPVLDVERRTLPTVTSFSHLSILSYWLLFSVSMIIYTGSSLMQDTALPPASSAAAILQWLRPLRLHQLTRQLLQAHQQKLLLLRLHSSLRWLFPLQWRRFLSLLQSEWIKSGHTAWKSLIDGSVVVTTITTTPLAVRRDIE